MEVLKENLALNGDVLLCADNFEERPIREGSLNCLGLHRLGLFAVGTDGVLRLFDIGGEEISIKYSLNLDITVSTFAFSYNFMKLTFGSPQVRILYYYVLIPIYTLFILL